MNETKVNEKMEKFEEQLKHLQIEIYFQSSFNVLCALNWLR